MIATDLPPEARFHTRQTVLALALGLLVGAATSGGQTVLGSPFGALANAVSPWLMAPFLIGSSVRSRRAAAFLGLGTCVTEVVGYYLTAAARGFGINPSTVGIWVVAGVVGGVVFGLAGNSWKWQAGWERGLGAALLIAAWACEAIVTYAVVLGYVGEAVVFAGVAVMLWVLLGLKRRQHLHVLAWFLPVAGLGVAGELALHAVL